MNGAAASRLIMLLLQILVATGASYSLGTLILMGLCFFPVAAADADDSYLVVMGGQVKKWDVFTGNGMPSFAYANSDLVDVVPLANASQAKNGSGLDASQNQVFATLLLCLI